MAQNLLAALGARIEAQLKGSHTRHHSIEADVKAKISINPPAPFTLLPDDAGQFGYLPTVVPRAIPVTKHGADFEALAPNLTPETFPSAADISAAIAPFAALFNNSAQVLIEPFTTTIVPTPTIVADVPTKPMDVLATGAETKSAPAVTMNATPVPPTPVATPKVAATPAATTPTSAMPAGTPVAIPAAAPAMTPPALTAPSVAGPTTANSSAATARILPPGAEVLADGTIIANLVPNVMPAVPAEFGVGATVRRKGVHSDVPMTVTVDYNGIIRATVTDSAGTRTFESPWDQFELVTRAPGS